MQEMTYGAMKRKALAYDELIENLTEIMLLSNIPNTELIRRTGMSHSHFERQLKARKLTNNQLSKIFRVIVEENNFMRVTAKKI